MLLFVLACLSEPTLVQVPVTVVPSATELTMDDVAITVTRAEWVLSDLRFEGPPETALRWSPISVAVAHPGHDFAGQVGGELLGEWTVDLLEETALGSASMYEGTYATARLSLPGEVVLEGVATVDEVDMPFAFTLVPDEAVTGISFDAVLEPEDPGEITLTVDLAHVLSFVDWSTADSDGDGVLTLDDGLLENTVTFGVVSTPSYLSSLER